MSVNELFWAGQEVYISEIFLPIIIGVLVFVPVLFVLFAFSGAWHYRLWTVGQTDDRSGNRWQRLKTTLAVAFANMRIIRSKELVPGIMHACIFGGAALLFIGKIVRLFSFTVQLTVPPQPVFLYFSLISEIGGVLIIIGGVIAVVRRFIIRPARLDNQPEDSVLYIWIFVIILTGYMIKGYRIAISDVTPTDWATWSPVGYLISHIFPTFLTEARNEILVWHRALIHTVPAFIFLGYIWLNRSRLQHMVISPLNVFYRSFRPKGELLPIDFETSENFGVSKIEDFTWKQLMDLDACTRCGRCQDVCPANISGKALSPKLVIQGLKDHLYETYPVPLMRKSAEIRKDMISEVITDEVVWDCTTCRACQEACPVYIEHVPKMIDMRRNLVMERVQLPEPAQDALKSLEDRGHPWRGTTSTRTSWTEGLEIPVISEDGEIDMLYWVGCTAALDERNMRVARATARIIKEAGIKFGILGAEEYCCGDPARRIGNEYLFQTLCQQNVEVLNTYNVKKILTTCPHCYNMLKYEYKQFGGDFEVVHHTQFIAGLIKEGKLNIGALPEKKAAYHDSCYLGRYNDIYEEPRDILKSIGGISRVELERCRSNSFCCGGGGGHMWMEEVPSQRVNERRVSEIVQAKVDLVATACPYCLIMFEDGIKAKEAEEYLKARDLSELVADALPKDEPPPATQPDTPQEKQQARSES